MSQILPSQTPASPPLKNGGRIRIAVSPRPLEEPCLPDTPRDGSQPGQPDEAPLALDSANHGSVRGLPPPPPARLPSGASAVWPDTDRRTRAEEAAMDALEEKKWAEFTPSQPRQSQTDLGHAIQATLDMRVEMLNGPPPGHMRDVGIRPHWLTKLLRTIDPESRQYRAWLAVMSILAIYSTSVCSYQVVPTHPTQPYPISSHPIPTHPFPSLPSLPFSPPLPSLLSSHFIPCHPVPSCSAQDGVSQNLLLFPR